MKKMQKLIIIVDKKFFLRYNYCMKQLTKKDMQKLKGQLNDLGYQLSEDPNPIVSTDDNNTAVNTVNTVCKTRQVVSDID
jgi:hypothetical protein